MILTPRQELAAMAIATGGHSALLVGEPGTGKSMFANRLISLFPRLSGPTHIEALRIHSLGCPEVDAGLLHGYAPFRAPHHGASSPAILGTPSAPGEVSLAHGGLLFLDEVVEFRRDVIEGLREPLQAGMIHVARAEARTRWEARSTFVAAMNPCPCGWYGSKRRECRCGVARISTYLGRLSGPIRDRIDIYLTFAEQGRDLAEGQGALVDEAAICAARHEKMVGRVEEARRFARRRNSKLGVRLNRDLQGLNAVAATGLSGKGLDVLGEASRCLHLTRRSRTNVLRVARTLADLDGAAVISEDHIRQVMRWVGTDVFSPLSPSLAV